MKKTREECLEVLASLPESTPRKGEVWRHYKGGRYDVLHVVLSANDASLPIVVYRETWEMGKGHYEPLYWARLLSEWTEWVWVVEPHDEGDIAYNGPRFVKEIEK
mgnify:CR=1 FL=1